MIIALVFEKNANFFVENCQKSQKIVIITSTPGLSLELAGDINGLDELLILLGHPGTNVMI
jgi:hypothetical protein